MLPRDGGNLYRGQTRAVVVEPPSPKVQWHPTDSETSRHGDRDGCIIAGMGCNIERPRSENRGIVVSGRTPDAHQWSGATGSLSGNSSICQRPNQYQYSSEDGQCIDQSIHKPSRGDSFKNHEFISHSDMEVVHRTEDLSYCGAPSGQVEPGGRHRVTDSQGPLRLDDPSRPVCPDPESSGTITDRLVCFPSNSPVTSILQLEAGSSSGSNRRFHSELTPSARICEPPMVPPPSYTGQDSTGLGISSVSGPLVEDTTLVPNPPPTAERVPITDSNTRQHSDISNSGGIHHAIRGTTVGRLATIQQHCRTGRLSVGATTLLDSAWRDKTKSTYESLFKRWDSWCKERDRDPIKGPIADILNFLAELFEQGYEYRSLNSYRSAISSVHEKVDGVDVGKHPLMTQMLKGAFNQRPPRPKYGSIWNVDQVLSLFKNDGPSDSLSLQSLTIKTVMLMALARPCRGADLAALDLNSRSYVLEGVVFKSTHLSKQSRPSHHQADFFFPSFQTDSCLCPVKTLKVYEQKTSVFRTNCKENFLFRSFIGKHGPVTASTIARWIKSCLQKAGIDTSKFQAYSTRAAAATKAAMSGVTVEEIMKATDWSGEGVFQKFYYRPCHSVKFGTSVLVAKALKSHVDMETEPSEV